MANKPKLVKFDSALVAVNKNFSSNQLAAVKCAENLNLSLRWLGYFLNFDSNNSANKIAEASYSAAVEATTLISLGALRSSILSLRCHYELFVMYLFYKDHRIELEASMDYRANLKLPGEVKKYFKDFFETFSDRWETLVKSKSRTDDDFYGKLSAVAHGSAVSSLPTARNPEEVIFNAQNLNQAELIFEGVAENLSDFCVAISPSNWLSLPDDQKKSLTARIGVDVKSKLKFH